MTTYHWFGIAVAVLMSTAAFAYALLQMGAAYDARMGLDAEEPDSE